MTEWQPIETAPKDGTEIILARIDIAYGEVDPRVWWVSSGFWSDRFSNWNDGIEPTGLADPNFWIPMLDPPK